MVKKIDKAEVINVKIHKNKRKQIDLSNKGRLTSADTEREFLSLHLVC
jgi:hypothetical protein